MSPVRKSTSRLINLIRLVSSNGNTASLVGLLVLVLVCSSATASQSNVPASPVDDRQQATFAVIESPEQVVHVLENLIRNIVYSVNYEIGSFRPQKRGLDLGINRGFSGSQAGKHLMGLPAASFEGGPGK